MFLIVGADSEIGSAALEASRAAGERALGTSRRDGSGHLRLDLDAIPGDWRPPEGTRAACVAAAVARLADCEADPARSGRINGARAVELVGRLAEHGVYTLFLSTNHVFSGRAAHVPAEAPASPISAYGRQKAQTEASLRRMMRGGAPVGILRLSKVLSPGMTLFADWRASLAAGRPARAFADMKLAPVPVALAARAIVAMMRAREARVAQLSGPRDVSYLGAARRIADLCGADAALVEGVRAADFGVPAGATPLHTTLDSRFAREALGIVVPDPIEVIDAIFRRQPPASGR